MSSSSNNNNKNNDKEGGNNVARADESLLGQRMTTAGLPMDVKDLAAVTTEANLDGTMFRCARIEKPQVLHSVKKSPFGPGKTGWVGKPSRPDYIKNPTDIINPKDFDMPDSENAKEENNESDDVKRTNWTVKDSSIRFLPTYYPLEKSSRFIAGSTGGVIATRISECCRKMSVHAKFDDALATAFLDTAEHVEIHVSLWKGGAKHHNQIIVEVQRRRGDPVAYHRYSRNILDAANGEFDTNGFAAFEEKERNFSHSAEQIAAKKASRGSTEHENSLLALEIADSLLKKDRMDARELGMESLCLLTDPSRTGMETALMASRVVLFGATGDDSEDDLIQGEFQIRQAVLSLVQFGKLSEGDFGMGDGDYMDSDDESEDGHPEDKDHNELLHNLALSVLSNALNVLEKYSNDLANGTQSRSEVAGAFLEKSEDFSSKDLLKTLLDVLGGADKKPHDACLSAKCLKSLCEASKDARKRARDLEAKTIVKTALDVGLRTHTKLEKASQDFITLLEKPEVED